MSFTVFYNKNGVEKPIKMSFLDAFRGVPDLKSQKPKSCSCCGKVHQQQVSSDEKKDTTDGDSSKLADNDLTDDDRTMIRLKEEKPGRPWLDILEATNFKDKATAVARWKEIEHKVQHTNEDKSKKHEPKNKKQKHYSAEQEAKHAKNREEGLRKKEEAKKKAEAEKKNESWTAEDKNDDKVKSSTPEPSNAKAKNTENNDMKAFADGYDRKKWLLAASKHYDKTGERITAAQAKAMADGK